MLSYPKHQGTQQTPACANKYVYCKENSAPNLASMVQVRAEFSNSALRLMGFQRNWKVREEMTHLFWTTV